MWAEGGDQCSGHSHALLGGKAASPWDCHLREEPLPDSKAPFLFPRVLGTLFICPPAFVQLRLMALGGIQVNTQG